jgi:hypothetical protein
LLAAVPGQTPAQKLPAGIPTPKTPLSKLAGVVQAAPTTKEEREALNAKLAAVYLKPARPQPESEKAAILRIQRAVSTIFEPLPFDDAEGDDE